MSNEEECLVPLQDQRVFGAGFKSKRVNFIPAAFTSAVQHTSPSTVTAANKYLSIVFKDLPSVIPNLNTPAIAPTLLLPP